MRWIRGSVGSTTARTTARLALLVTPTISPQAATPGATSSAGGCGPGGAAWLDGDAARAARELHGCSDRQSALNRGVALLYAGEAATAERELGALRAREPRWTPALRWLVRARAASESPDLEATLTALLTDDDADSRDFPDQKYGTRYYRNFVEFMKKVQKEDLSLNCAQTDVKGNRPWRPHQQKDPDLYLRVVEKKSDGIIVNGAKAHNSCSVYVEEIVAIPSRSLTPEEKDWAVAFSVPSDWEGVTIINASYSPTKRKKLLAPMWISGRAIPSLFSTMSSPWERVFLFKEVEFSGQIPFLFGANHRQTYGGCKAGVS